MPSRASAMGLLSLLSASSATPHVASNVTQEAFYKWRLQHNKEYESSDELDRRLEIFRDNLDRIAAHNARLHQHGWEMRANQFADLTSEEFASYKNGLLPTDTGASLLGAGQLNLSIDTRLSAATPGSAVDWRQHNLVNPVQNQGQCGSCWAFSTVVSVEGQHAKATGKLVKLSEQNLVDCVKGESLPGTLVSAAACPKILRLVVHSEISDGMTGGMGSQARV